ncbi:MAG: FAD:protein FMN transferase [Saprospiraceae bacterium]|nr:FAD:protein FMN transferase [Saprospiraceae bacterium]
MGTVFRLVFFTEKDTQQAAAIARAVFLRVDSLNASMSDYLPESELNRLCATAGSGRAVRVSDDFWKVLRLSARFSRKSGGAFDVTIGPLTRLWRRARNLKELPDSLRVEEARALVDYRNIEFRRGQSVVLKKAGMRLDLGGIAQGYAADVCLKILKDNGIPCALVDAGGDIALGQAPPDESGWKIVLPALHDSLRGQTLRLSDCGITTSGATYRYLEANGRRYSHLIDPRSGWGLTHRVLVSVKAPDAVTADAWATALSVLGETGLKQLARPPQHIEVWWNGQ